MQKALAIVLAGVGAVAMTSAVAAASRDTHHMSVPLPDGSVAQIDYVGDVAPKVRVTPAPFPTLASPFALFDPTMFDMQKRIDAMMKQIDTLARQPVAGAGGFNVASLGDAPAGTRSITVVSTSDGGHSCTRTTEVMSQGAGKPPKVVTNASGDCAVPGPAARPVTPS